MLSTEEAMIESEKEVECNIDWVKELEKMLFKSTSEFIKANSSADKVLYQFLNTNPDEKFNSDIWVLQERISEVRKLVIANKYHEILRSLFKCVPYIKSKHEEEEVLRLGRTVAAAHGDDVDNDDDVKEAIRSAANMCHSMLVYMEGKIFHPLYRKGHMDELLTLVNIIEMQNNQELKRKFQFVNIECSSLESLIMTSKKYMEQADLHQQFDSYITSYFSLEDGRVANLDVNALLNIECTVETLLRKDDFVPAQYASLDRGLVKHSLKERLFFVKMLYEVDCYVTQFRELLVKKKKAKGGEIAIDLLIGQLELAGFFNLPDKELDERDFKDWTEWTEVIKEQAFLNLPNHYVVRGILEYSNLRSVLDNYDFMYNDGLSYKIEIDQADAQLQHYAWWKRFHLEQVWRSTRLHTKLIYKDFGNIALDYSDDVDYCQWISA